jgi:hypothetical protein
MVSACAFYLAAFAPEGMVTGSGAGRALFFGRYGCSLRRPTQAQGFVRRHSPDCIPARGVTNIFALAAALTGGELTAPDLLRCPIPYSPPAHVCTPGVWNGRRKFKRVGGGGDKLVQGPGGCFDLEDMPRSESYVRSRG